MRTQIDQLTLWLNSAYSMEQSVARVLENHAKDARDFPEIRERDEQHIAETHEHAARLKECLDVIGEKPSMAKSMFGTLSGIVQGASTGIFRDELLKNFLGDYATEHFEIACYRSLIAAAEEVGQPRIAELCRANLRDEEAMARWLDEKIPEITRISLLQQLVQT